MVHTPVAFDRTGARLATTMVGPVHVWDVASGEKILTIAGFKGLMYKVVFSPDGTRIAGSGGNLKREFGVVKVWDATSGEELLDLVGHSDSVASVCFSPDGSRLVTGTVPIRIAPRLRTVHVCAPRSAIRSR